MNCRLKINCYKKRLIKINKKNKTRNKVIRINCNNCVGKYKIMKIKLIY